MQVKLIELVKKYYLIIILLGIITLLGGLNIFQYLSKNNAVVDNVELVEQSKQEEKEEAVSSEVFVDIKGAVNKPGVYQVQSSARVNDVVKAAGGLSKTADLSYINLSKKVSDEMTIIIYTKDEVKNMVKKEEIKCVCPEIKNDGCLVENNNGSSSNQPTEKPSGKVAINTASLTELMSLTGIGEVVANRIITYRKEVGLFKTIEDIKNVSGIGDAVYNKIKENITV